MPTLRVLLSDLTKVEGIVSAVVVGRDGFVIDSASNGASIDSEAVGAVISTGIGSAEIMGRELKVGEMTQSMLEYKDGIIVMNTLGRDAILAIVADTKANVGNIRYQLKKRSADIERAM